MIEYDSVDSFYQRNKSMKMSSVTLSPRKINRRMPHRIQTINQSLYRGFPRKFWRAPNGTLVHILGRHLKTYWRLCLWTQISLEISSERTLCDLADIHTQNMRISKIYQPDCFCIYFETILYQCETSEISGGLITCFI